MTDLVARTADIAAKARAATPTKAANRAAYPDFARWVDEWTAVGGVLMHVRWPDGREWKR